MYSEKIVSLFRRLFETPEGAAVLHELEIFAQMNDAEYIADANLAAYLQGRRSVVCEIRKILQEKK